MEKDNIYYVPVLPYIKKDLSNECKGLIIPENKNLIRLNSAKDRKNFIQSIKNIQFIKDKELYDFYKKNMPEITDVVTTVPIKSEELKDALKQIFHDIPDESFEGKTILQCLTTTFNYVIQKNEIDFLAINIANDELRYDLNYKYTKFQEFYFYMLKFAFNLDPYWLFFSATQDLIQKLFLKEVLFSDDTIDRQKEQLLNRVFNINGKALSEFHYQLSTVVNKIQANKITIDRTKIPIPSKYKKYEIETTRKIKKLQDEMIKKIEYTNKAKKELRGEVRLRHGIISKNTAKKLLRGIPYIGGVFED